MAYPTALDSFTPKVDTTDDVMALDVNELQTAIENIETELGTDPAGDQTDLKTRLENGMTDSGYILLGDGSTKTISAGVITVTGNFHKVETEGSAASDDLDTINGYGENQFIYLLSVNDARDIVFKHGTGNIYCAGGEDFTLSTSYELAILVYDNTNTRWVATKAPYEAVTGGGTVATGGYTLTVPATGTAALLGTANVFTAINTFGDGTNQMTVAADGEIGLEGTARVTKSIWLGVSGIKAPGTKPATFKEWGISGVWEFSDATDDTIVANLKFPEDMDMTVAPTFAIGWSTNTAVTSETAVWQLEYLYTQAGEDVTAAAQGTLTVNSDAIAQADGLIVASITGLDVPNAADVCIHCRVKRLGDDADDDLTDTAEMSGICLSYTSDKLGTAT